MNGIGGGDSTNIPKARVSNTVDIIAGQVGWGVWIPSAGKRFVITHLHISVSVAGEITVWDGVNANGSIVLHGTYAINGGVTLDFSNAPFISSAVGNSLRYTTGAGITGFITVHGYEL